MNEINIYSLFVSECTCLSQRRAIYALNEGLRVFYEAVRRDEAASAIVEIAIITFGDGGVKCVRDFGDVYSSDAPELYAGGMTPMGGAVDLAADMIVNRLNAYQEIGCGNYTPWLILMTDGMPNGNPLYLQRAVHKVIGMESRGELLVFPVAVGDDADVDTLRLFSRRRRPIGLLGLNFTEMFRWFSESISRVAASMPGDRVNLGSTEDWGEIL
ncbi:MAG: hypothetical protein IJU26_08320 [Synergistaceae bacterium]|nr:hypothetical protein [Synergistaceae bacterium]